MGRFESSILILSFSLILASCGGGGGGSDGSGDAGGGSSTDTTPEAFSLLDQTGVDLLTEYESNTVIVSGLDAAAAISIAEGEYAIDGGSFSANAATISQGQEVAVRQVSSDQFSTTTNAILTIGGVSDSWSLTTLAEDQEPDGFVFADQADVELATVITSNVVTITGINSSAPMSIDGGEYSIDGGSYRSVAGTVTNNQTVQVRQTSAEEFTTTTGVILTVGGESDTFSVTTLAEDLDPDSFSFIDQTGVAPNMVTTSAPVNITAINSTAHISVSGGEYAIDGGTFTTAAGTITNNQQVRVRQTASPNYSTTTTATLTVGSISDAFDIATQAQALETVPDQFAFYNQVDVPLNTQISSNAVIIAGIEALTSISITGGEYSIDGGEFTAVPGTVANHQQVAVRQTSSPRFDTATEAILNVGGVADAFRVTTLVEDSTPDSFSLIGQFDVESNTIVTSNAVIITGINTATTISIVDGEYAIDGGVFTALDGTINAGQSVQARQTSSASFDETTEAILTIGTSSDAFSVTTRVADTEPDVFSFADQNDVPLADLQVSDTITVNGIEAAVSITVTGGEYAIDGGNYTATAGTVNNGQEVTLRQASSSEFSTQTDVVLTIGGINDRFSVTTLAEDSAPDQFTFDDHRDAPLNATIESSAITITGINTSVSITTSDGEYSIDGDAYTAVPGTVTGGQEVRVRQTSSADFSSQSEVTATVGSVSAIFSVTTLAEDLVPEAFSFASVGNVSLSDQVESEPVVISGINNGSPISIVGGEYAIDGLGFASLPGTVENGQTLSLRLTAANTAETVTEAIVTIGGVSETFPVTTRAALEDNPPILDVQFPPAISLSYKDAVTVYGTAGDDSSIADISVNGVPASTTDGFATWQATIDIANGLNTISVVAKDSENNHTPEDLQIRKSFPIQDISNVVVNSAGDTIYLSTDYRQFIRIDRATGIPESLRSPGLSNYLSSDLRLDEANNRLLYSKISLGPAIYQLDLIDNSFSLLADFRVRPAHTDYNVDLRPAGSVVVNPLNQDEVLVIDYYKLLAVNVGDNLTRRIVSNELIGNGPLTFSSPYAYGSLIEHPADANKVLSVGRGFPSGFVLVEFDLNSGDRQILSGGAKINASGVDIGNGPSIVDAYSLSVHPGDSNQILVSSGDGAVYTVDLTSGIRAIVSGSSRGAGPNFTEPQRGLGLQVNPQLLPFPHPTDSSSILVLEAVSRELSNVTNHVGYDGRLYVVDLASGDRALVSGDGLGSGDTLLGPMGLMPDPVRSNAALVVDFQNDALYSVNLLTGDRTTLSDAGSGVGAGPALYSPVSLLAGPQPNTAYVVDADTKAIYKIDLQSGARTVELTDARLDSNQSIGQVTSFAVDPANNRLLIGDERLGAIVEHNLSTGTRRILSQSIGYPQDVKLDVSGNRLLVADRGLDSIESLDLDTLQQRTLTSRDQRIGDGLPIYPSNDVAYDQLMDTLYLTGGRFLFSAEASSGDRTLTMDDADRPITDLAFDEANRQLLGSRRGSMGNADSIQVLDVDTGRFHLEPINPTPNNIAPLSNATLIAFGDSGELYVMDTLFGQGSASLYQLDPGTGARQIVSGFSTGTGPTISNPTAILQHPGNGDVVLALDEDLQALIAIDVTNGNRAILSDSGNGGPGLSLPQGLAVNPLDAGAVISYAGGGSARNQIISIDLASGERTTVSSVPTNDPLSIYSVVALIPSPSDPGAVLVLARTTGPTAGYQLPTLMTIDVATGIRTLISRNSPDLVGSGYDFRVVSGLSTNPDDPNLVWVTQVASSADESDHELLSVNLVTGERSFVAKIDAAEEMGRTQPRSIKVAPWDVNQFLIAHANFGILLFDQFTGQTVVFSR